LVSVPAQEKNLRPDEDIFQSTNLPRLSIQIPDEGMELLRRSRSARSQQTKPQAQARVMEGERVYTNVTVQLKGFTSFQPIDRLPGLTLNFDKLAPGQNFHGLTKISLNNSLQDPSRLHEKLARELFAAAGVPVPRAAHALVTLNGRELGLYVLTEGFDKTFLSHHFKRSDGNLYEGHVAGYRPAAPSHFGEKRDEPGGGGTAHSGSARTRSRQALSCAGGGSRPGPVCFHDGNGDHSLPFGQLFDEPE
jgi:spore coat protein CotH